MADGDKDELRLLLVNPYPVHQFRSTANLVRFTNLVGKFRGSPNLKPALLTGGGRSSGGWDSFDGVPQYRLPGPVRSSGAAGLLWFMLVSPLYGLGLFRSFRPDLVYVSESYCAPLVFLLRLFYGKRARITYDVMGLNARQVRLGAFSLKSLLLGAVYSVLDGMIFRSADLVTTINEAHREVLEESLGCEVPVVRDGIDPDRFGAVERPSDKSGRQTLVFIGKLAHRRLDVLFSSLSDILERCPSLDMRIVGGGPDESVYRAWCSRLDPDGSRLRMDGFTAPENIPAVLAACDIAYSDDWSGIGFPLKVYEYMAAGLPPVVEDTAAVREVLSDGRTALLYRDREGLIEAVESLASDESYRARLGRAAAEEVRAKYTWSGASDKLLELYREQADRT
jgi:glycosyltransferase involved in cell wall biosynthesis